MNIASMLPSIFGKLFGTLSGASQSNPKSTNTISAAAVLAGAWFGIDASTFAGVGETMCAIGETLQKVPSF